MANNNSGDDEDIHELVLEAVAAIDLDKTKQELKTPVVPLMNGPSARYIVNCLECHPHAVDNLDISFNQLSQRAMEIYRDYCRTTTTLQNITIDGPLGNAKGRRLLSCLHGNTCITHVALCNNGFHGTAGGAIISDLLLNNSQMTTLVCGHTPLGPAGARALDQGIRGNHTLASLILYGCSLQDEGVLAVASALEGNNTVEIICLQNNQITSNGLPDVTRLLQHTSIKGLDVSENPGLFTDEENTRLFASALQNTTLRGLCLDLCRLPGHALTALFQAVANHPTIAELAVFDNDSPLQGAGLASLQDNLSQMNLIKLNVNLDFTDPFFLSSLRKNKTLCHLYSCPIPLLEEITTGPVFAILKRNRRLRKANKLLEHERQTASMLPEQVWGCAMWELACDESGSTAVYTVLCEKLVMWWPPH